MSSFWQWWFSLLGLQSISNRVHFKDVERNALSADPDLGEPRPDFGIEAIAVHSEKDGSIAKPNKPRRDVSCCSHRSFLLWWLEASWVGCLQKCTLGGKHGLER